MRGKLIRVGQWEKTVRAPSCAVARATLVEACVTATRAGKALSATPRKMSVSIVASAAHASTASAFAMRDGLGRNAKRSDDDTLSNYRVQAKGVSKWSKGRESNWSKGRESNWGKPVWIPVVAVTVSVSSVNASVGQGGRATIAQILWEKWPLVHLAATATASSTLTPENACASLHGQGTTAPRVSVVAVLNQDFRVLSSPLLVSAEL
ncbi:unnamed protein product [Cyprideis torosa]|uniref:Uncharacterized protein n=1 Tax=Cyprideis torosa TaxID=163714 RepID=A0A7R8W7T8_9CRUS|nr:unnamed protein product [Cyprideis torosa]CAG0887917.1 unnamed protein product [Cyprideis torosa]